MKLYEIPADYARAAAEYQRVMEETEEMFTAGEIDAKELDRRYDAAAENYGEYLGFTAETFTAKAEATAMVMLNLQAEAEIQSGFAKPFDTEAARYRQRQKAFERQADRLKLYIKAQMERMGLDEVKGARLKLAIQKNSSPSILSYDLDAVPEGFLVPQPPKVNAELVRKHVSNTGEEIPGLSIVRGTHLRVR